MRKIFTLPVLCLVAGIAWSQDIPEYCLENYAAQHYVHDFVYDDNDYTYTKILDYCDPEPLRYYKYDGYRKDQPLPASIEFAAAAQDAQGLLTVSENEDYTDSLTYVIEQGATAYDIYNLIPGRTYYYKVEYPDQGGQSMTIAKTGAFKTTGTLRMLKVDGIFNVRDMGGWTGLGGNQIKYGKLFRGSRMTWNGSGNEMITALGKQQMLDAGIRADLDLRTSSERNISSSPLAKNTGAKVDYNYIDDSYKSRISTFDQSDASIRAIKWIISELKKDKPVYFHCSVGADRTGTVAFLIGALCGMSEDALAKEFELTSFSADSVVTSGKIEDLRRRRTYDGRFDNNEADYKYALLIDKVKALSGTNLQRKVYNHLKTGISGNSISEGDLDWLIKYLVDYAIVKSVSINKTRLAMNPGETFQLTAKVTPTTATNPTVTFTSSNPGVATVTPEGLVTALRGGTARITATADGVSKTMTVTVPLVESYLPATVQANGKSWITSTNIITNGSFEYSGYFANWTAANEREMSLTNFDIVNFENSDSVYVQSKANGDETSANSIRTLWKITTGKTYAFGYRIKNSTDIQTTENPNIATSLVKLDPSIYAGADDFIWDDDQDSVYFRPMPIPMSGNSQSLALEYPSYDGNWTDVIYVFTNTDGYPYLQFLATHLSQNGNNTCFDNFFLTEVTEDETLAPTIKASLKNSDAFDLSGRAIQIPQEGIMIIDGKAYFKSNR